MNPVEKLALLRAEMKKRHLDAYVVVTDDFHTSEYVGAHFKAREFLSGFTGSAGTLVVLPDAAALWTDGRYFLQASQQLEGSGIELMRMGQPGVPEIPAFLRDHVPENGWIGFDSRTISNDFARSIGEKTREKLRRCGTKSASQFRCGGLVLDEESHTVTADGESVALTYKEFELLRLFLSHPGTAFSRDQLMADVWGTDYCGETRTVDMHIRTLRQKLGAYGEKIETVRGVGYRMEGKA